VTGRLQWWRGSLVLVGVFLAAGCGRSSRAKDAAVETCIAAVRASGDQADSTLAGKKVASACAPLFEEEACREGYTKAWADSTSEAERVGIMMDACCAAYCPKIDDPKPTTCTAEAADVSGRSTQWRQFQQAVLTRDLGPARADRVLAAMTEAGNTRLKGMQ
jgi:hypothetical protein